MYKTGVTFTFVVDHLRQAVHPPPLGVGPLEGADDVGGVHVGEAHQTVVGVPAALRLIELVYLVL